MSRGTDASGLRLAELMVALSLATDLARGRPMEHELRPCLLAVRLGELLGFDEDRLSDVYYVALLRWIGCTGHAHELSVWFGDEIAAHARAATFDFGRGWPRGLRGEELTFGARIVQVAQDPVVFHRLGGVEAAGSAAEELRREVRSGRLDGGAAEK